MTRAEAIKSIAELPNILILAGADEGKLRAAFRKNIEALEALGWEAPAPTEDEPKTPAQVAIEAMIEKTVWVRPINTAFAAYDCKNKLVPDTVDKTAHGAALRASAAIGGMDGPYAHVEFIAVHDNDGNEQPATPPQRLRRMRAGNN